MLSIGIAVASYKLLAVSIEKPHHTHIAEAMEMQRICDCGKEHSMLFVMSKSFALAHYFVLAKSILNLAWRIRGA